MRCPIYILLLFILSGIDTVNEMERADTLLFKKPQIHVSHAMLFKKYHSSLVSACDRSQKSSFKSKG